MRTLLPLVLLASAAVAGDAEVLRHDLALVLDPQRSSFEATDRVRVRGPGRLHVAAPEGVEVEGGEHEVGAGEHEIVVRFRGVVSNPVKKSAAATWVSGDRTAGTIGPEGTYLVRGFYVPSRTPARFRVTITTPLAHHAVAPGRRVAEEAGDATRTVVFETSSPLDGMVVVAGPWVVDEAEIDGVSCRTYLREADRAHAGLLLDTLRAEVPRFQAMLGPVPDGRFDVVENFFATGYGFPNFTLLGDTVIRYVCAKTKRAGKKTLPAGYLDHELVHAWLGNHLLVAYERGNWCEALTTWFANYGAAEREGTDAAYRRKVSRSFSLRVGEENDYPLREFKAKEHAFENDIGYGKGSMVFHMLARDLGRETFLEAVRHAVETRGGRALGWDDLVAALSEGCGRDLKPWFEPWLARTGAPVLEVGALHVEGARITGTVRQAQDGPAYPLAIPVRVTTADGVEEHVVRSASKETAFLLETKAAPRRVELDPDHHVFRRVPRAHVAPCLEAVRTAGRRVGFGAPGLLGSLDVEAIEPALPRDAAVLAVGLPESVREAVLSGARRQDHTLEVSDGSFEFRGETYDEPGHGILFSYARPDAPPVCFFHGNAEPAYARTRYLPYYASSSWVVFRDGRPVARGVFESDRRARAEITPAREGPPGSILADLLYLTDPARRGREAGAEGDYGLANVLRGRLFRAGLRHVAWPPVDLPFWRLVGERRLVLADGTVLDACFFPFHASASPRKGEAAFARVVRHPAKSVGDALVLVPEDAPEEAVLEYARGGAAAIAIVSGDEAFSKRAREAAWENALPPFLAERLARRGGNAALAVRGMIVRSKGPILPVPFVYLGQDAAARAAASGRGTLAFRIERDVRQTHNVVGVLGAQKQPAVLLSAHWDGVGTIDGNPAPGAADNAAGVACVLWVAKRLKRDLEAGRLRRPVVVALFGGEEAGLAGSRQFAALAHTRMSPIVKPGVAVNVDGVGSHTKPEVFLIGRSHHPEFLAPFEAALEPSGLTLGRDIDEFAYREGSDHWPLHEKDIPAVTVYCANYRTMNGLEDTLDKVDVGTVRKVAHTVYRFVLDLAGK